MADISQWLFCKFLSYPLVYVYNVGLASCKFSVFHCKVKGHLIQKLFYTHTLTHTHAYSRPTAFTRRYTTVGKSRLHTRCKKDNGRICICSLKIYRHIWIGRLLKWLIRVVIEATDLWDIVSLNWFIRTVSGRETVKNQIYYFLYLA